MKTSGHAYKLVNKILLKEFVDIVETNPNDE